MVIDEHDFGVYRQNLLPATIPGGMQKAESGRERRSRTRKEAQQRDRKRKRKWEKEETRWERKGR